ncbi:MAG: 4Fe-4S binding protein [Eubacteriales bacterium]
MRLRLRRPRRLRRLVRVRRYQMIDGVAVIDEDLCTGCTMCVAACPRSIIKMLPKDQTVVVLCRNRRLGALLGCSAKPPASAVSAAKACPSDSIHVVNGLASIDESTCTRCGACIPVCPMKCIVNFYESDPEDRPPQPPRRN